jgi:hypothetical protein
MQQTPPLQPAPGFPGHQVSPAPPDRRLATPMRQSAWSITTAAAEWRRLMTYGAWCVRQVNGHQPPPAQHPAYINNNPNQGAYYPAMVSLGSWAIAMASNG